MPLCRALIKIVLVQLQFITCCDKQKMLSHCPLKSANLFIVHMKVYKQIGSCRGCSTHSFIHLAFIYEQQGRRILWCKIVCFLGSSVKRKKRCVNKKLHYSIRALPGMGSRQLGLVIRKWLQFSWVREVSALPVELEPPRLKDCVGWRNEWAF